MKARSDCWRSRQRRREMYGDVSRWTDEILWDEGDRRIEKHLHYIITRESKTKRATDLKEKTICQ